MQLTIAGGRALRALPLALAAEWQYVGRIVALDDEIPGRATLTDWPTAPTAPLRLLSVDRCRDGGPRGGTVLVALADATDARFPLFFDNFLGRLCFGADPDAPDAAFIGKGSALQRELFSLLPMLPGPSDAVDTLRACLEHAATWT